MQAKAAEYSGYSGPFRCFLTRIEARRFSQCVIFAG
jgi:hypothetical protein